MKHSRPQRKSKAEKPPQPPSRFAPAAFLSGSAESVQTLCDELATLATNRFKDLAGTTWSRVGSSIVDQLRAIGHDLHSFDDSEGFQEWHASWHHPRGNFSLFLSFRAPHSVEVTWRTDDSTYTAHG